MTEPEFLERSVVLVLHDEALSAYGGIRGVKDDGLLDSALSRPVNQFAYADPPGPDLFDLAAAYAFGLARNHAFNDGNKRTAWACCVLFLKVNGCPRYIPTPDAVEQIIRLVERRVDEPGFADWLRRSPSSQ